MTSPDLINLIASIASLILSVIAIALSVYFYTQSKNTETSVSALLEGIRSQTDALQKIVARQMGQLIRGVTEQPVGGEVNVYSQMISAIKDIPINITTLLQLPSASERAAQQTAQYWRGETIRICVVAFYYAVVTNLAHQIYLPPIEQLQDGNIFRRFVDGSYADMVTLEKWLSSLTIEELQASQLFPLYQEAIALRNNAKDSVGVYAERAAVSS